MTNIAIIGYGKMGQAIEKVALEQKKNVVVVIDPFATQKETHSGIPIYAEMNEQSLKEVDVCIDFTHPNVVIKNIETASRLKKNLVIGTTGWYNAIADVTKIIEKEKTGLIWSGNFSIGVNAFFSIVRHAAKICNNLESYDPMLVEYHHNQKADSPSGTALMTANIMIEEIKRKKRTNTEKIDGKIQPEELHVASVRGGAIPGIHEVTLDSPEDSITITHSARTREGFARGAVMAADFIAQKKGMYTIDDLMSTIIGGEHNDNTK